MKKPEVTLDRIEIFTKNVFDSRLHNQALSGNLQGFRAFSVTGDYRIIFEEIDD